MAGIIEGYSIMEEVNRGVPSEKSDPLDFPQVATI
jgi:hypothetical protein